MPHDTESESRMSPMRIRKGPQWTRATGDEFDVSDVPMHPITDNIPHTTFIHKIDQISEDIKKV